jgi:tetratricopeptide (TPR) repeat protein
MFDRIIKICLHLAVFLAPLFFLPFSSEALEFNKQYLLFFLALVAGLAWLAKMIVADKEFKFKKTPFDIPILAFLFLAILSAIFSADRFSSLLGTYGRFSDGLIGLLSLGLFYFLFTNNTDKTSGFAKTFMWSSLLVVLVALPSVFGIWGKIGLPFQQTFNTISGSMEGLSIFICALVVYLILTILLRASESKILSWIILILSLGLLVIIDANISWIVLSFSLLVFIVFALVKRTFKENVNRLLLPITIMLMAAVFLFVNLPRWSFNSLPHEAILGQQESWSVSFKSATDNFKTALVGSGVGTFSYDFSKFKSLEFNETALWQIRFDRSGSAITEILATMGIPALLAYLIFIGLFLISGLVFFQPKNQEAGTRLPFVMAGFALFVGQFVYYQNTSIAFAFWLFLGLSAVGFTKGWGELKYSFKNFPEMGLIFNIVLMVIAAGALVLFFFAGRFYWAEVKYTKALMSSDIAIQTANLESAAKLNPIQSQYGIILSRLYLTSANLQKAFDTAKAATDKFPKKVSVWETLALVYRESQPVSGAADWAIKSFQTALSLEPKNPAFYTEIGKLLVATNADDAAKNFEKALELKSNYPAAVIQQALLLESKEYLPGAIKKIEDLVAAGSVDVDVLFQLGRMYYNAKRVDEAISVFEQIVLVYPNHSNTLYALGTAYTAKGEKDMAIAQFEKVLKLNPGNQDVIDKINLLKK